MREEEIARAISLILSPNMYSLVICTIYWCLKDFEGGLYAWFMLSFSISLLPFLFIYYDTRRGKIDIFVSKREERTKYFILTLSSYILGFLMLNIFGITVYNILLLTYFLVGITLFIQNTRYKVSVHAAGIGGPTTMLVLEFDSYFWLLYLTLLPVMWSRLKMKAHSLTQLVSGTITSIAITFIVLLFIKKP